jgi:cephalosporin-C deacetylase-like acetyl esterase
MIASDLRSAVTVHDLTYPSPVDGEPISAYLVTPPGAGPFPGILYVHWYEPSSSASNRTQFLAEAVTLAQTDGVMALLVATMWSEPSWYREGRSLATDYDDAVQQTMELRRALDVLLAQPGIDPARVAYVRHDFGAMFGAILAGVDRRAKAYVLIAGASDFNRWMLFGVEESKPGLAAYKAKMATLAPSHFIAEAAPAALLFQFGTEDFYTPAAEIDAFFHAASEPKQIQRYPTEHAMKLPAIQADRLAFLRAHLELSGS